MSGLQRLRQLLIVNLPFRLPLPPEPVLLPLAEIIQGAAQEEGHQHHHNDEEDILVDGAPLLLDGLDGHITHQEDGPIVYRPHIV